MAGFCGSVSLFDAAEKIQKTTGKTVKEMLYDDTRLW